VAATGSKDAKQKNILVFFGWVIAWVSTTIARYVYPPPKRWLKASTTTP
jgi:hypothetical protein